MHAMHTSTSAPLAAQPGLPARADPPGHASPARPDAMRSPFDLDDDSAYQRWRAAKLATRATHADELVVELADANAISTAERSALLERLTRCNVALYRCRAKNATPPVGTALVHQLARQLGLRQIDRHWLAEEDGVSSIAVASAPADESGAAADRAAFIPYTDRALGWHTDGYYHPAQQQIRGMLLHCVRPARQGGETTLLDHELAYILLRDESPAHIQALMASDAMTIPGRRDAAGEARAAQGGPVFTVHPHDGTLHMRYTARTRSIEWRTDAATRAATAALQALLAPHGPHQLALRLEAGMGIVSHNLLHHRSAFDDDPAQPRLLYRARYLDRSAAPPLRWCGDVR